jgi:hypothetical protein
MLRSSFLAQSRCGFLHFSFKLFLLSSNIFDWALISSISGLFSFSEKDFLVCRNFLAESQHFLPFGKKASCFQDSRSTTCISFQQRMLITATNAVTLPVFAVLIAISSALMLLLGAVSTTLIGWDSVDK